MIPGKTYIGDAYETLTQFPSQSVWCCVTSPPYWGHRLYSDDPREIGGEVSVNEYIARLAAVFAEVKRVLHPSGTLWLNIGDTYLNKSLVGIPWRVLFELQSQGWLHRSTIVWHKPNAQPGSAKDRPGSSWEPVMLFAKRPHYYFDAYAIREPTKTRDTGRGPRDLWQFVVGSERRNHPAAFPVALVRKCLLAGCPRLVCLQCGSPFERSVRYERTLDGVPTDLGAARSGDKRNPSTAQGVSHGRIATRAVDGGFSPGCKCEASPLPGVVLDPFMGSGTVAFAAQDLGLRWVGIDIVNTEDVK